MPTEATSPPHQPTPAKRLSLGWLLLWMMVGLLVRLLPLGRLSMKPGGPSAGAWEMATGAESLLHLRRIHQTLQHFPELPTWEPYLGSPGGALIPLDPGLDLLLAWLTRILSGGSLAPEGIVQLVSILMPILGILLIPIYVSLARQLFGHGAARLSAPLLALLPGVAWFNLVGQVNVQAIAPMIFGLPFIPLLSALERCRQSPKHPDLFNLAVMTGTFLGAGFFFWRDTLVPAAVMTLYLGLRTLGQLRRGPVDGFALWGGPVTLITAGAVATPICISLPLGAAGIIEREALSWYQPLFLLAMGTGLAILGAITRSMIKETPHGLMPPTSPVGRVAIAALLGLMPIAMLARISPSFLEAVIASLRAESHSPLASTLFPHGLPLLGLWGLPILPGPDLLQNLPILITLPWALWRLARKSQPRGGSLIWVWVAVLVAWVGLHPGNASLITAIGAVALAAAVDLTVREGRGLLSRVAGRLPLWLALLPSIAVHGATIEIAPQAPGTLEVAQWLAENTPATQDRPGGPAEYGILASPALTPALVAVARRTALSGMRHPSWLNAQSERWARWALSSPNMKTLEDWNARYIVVGDLPTERALAQSFLGPHASDPDGNTTLAALGQGIATDTSPLRSRLRLLHDALGTWADPKGRYRVYERVPGAIITGPAPVGSHITLEIDLTTPAGTTLHWRHHTLTGPDGRYRLRSPYPTRAPSAAVHPRGPGRLRYRLPSGRQLMATVEIHPLDVLEGRSVSPSAAPTPLTLLPPSQGVGR